MTLISTFQLRQSTVRPWLSLALSLAAVMSTACAQVDQGFAAVNKGVNTINKAVGLPPVGGATMTPQQQAEFHEQLSVKLQDARIAKARQEAGPAIEKVVHHLACYVGDPTSVRPELEVRRPIARLLSPDMGGMGWPGRFMRYHPADQCVSVRSMDEWGMPALNALRFRVNYISDVSGEVASSNYLLVKQSSGEWLFAPTY